jgi:uncharacterized protein YjbI with pentapeptide repeats
MGDEGQQSEGKRPVPEGFATWNAYWTAHGMPWRTEPELGAERQAYLRQRRAITPDIAQGIYPFRDTHGRITLARADVEWLLATHENGGLVGPVDWSDAKQRQRGGLDLRGADLSGADLHALPLAGLRGSLSFEDVFENDTDRVDAAAVMLHQADLRGASLEGAWLRRVELDGADLRGARLARAELYNAFLRGARLGQSQLAGASLRRAVLSADTNLYGAQLSDETHGAVRLRDIRWNGADVTFLDWKQIPMLGDEQVIRARLRSHRRARPNDYANAARATRQLAVVLRSVGLNDDADRFAYRAQRLQRALFRQQRHYGKWLFSLLLALLSGYGYRLGRILVAYGVSVVLFAVLYLVLSSGCTISATPSVFASGTHCMATGHTYTWVEAFVISVTAFHGRVFAEGYQPGTPFGILAAIEAVGGLVIEGVFIAMLTQRFFAR